MPDLTRWVSSSERDGLCTDQGHLVVQAGTGTVGKSAERGGPGRSHLRLIISTIPASQFSLGQGVVPSSLPRLPWSF